MSKYIGHFLLISLLLLNAAAAKQLTIIKLQYRSADELIPVIQPLLNDREGISGRGYELYLNAGAKTQQTIRQLVAKLDQKPAQLLISVKNLDISHDNNSRYALSGGIKRGSTQINIGGSKNSELQLEASDRSIISTQRRTPQVRATEGEPALIGSGQTIPFKTKRYKAINGQVIETDVTDLVNTHSGFYVTAWLNDERVTLNIEQQKQSLNSNRRINTAGINTTVSGRLGEWIAIGGIQESSTRNQNKTFNPEASRITTTRDNTVYIKVERVE